MLLLSQAKPAALPMNIPPWALWAAGILGLGLMVFSVVRNSRKVVRSGDDAPASEAQKRWMAGIGISRRASPKPGKSPQADAELQAAAGELVTQLDQRAERLERLIHQADARLAELRRLTAGTDNPGSASRPIPEVKPGLDAPGPSSRTSQVYRLADEGYSAPEIAEATGVAIGEINLVLALRN
jgi:hypothetical protein